MTDHTPSHATIPLPGSNDAMVEAKRRLSEQRARLN